MRNHLSETLMLNDIQITSDYMSRWVVLKRRVGAVTSQTEASKRTASKKTEKKDPISTETLIELCTMFKDSTDLLIIRGQ